MIMKLSIKFTLLIFCLFVLSVMLISGCGSNAAGGGGASVSNRVGTYTYNGTQPHGDAWSWLISTETFIGSNETTGDWITGEWHALSSGFSKAKIIDSDISGLIGESAYFLEFPNTMLLAKVVGPGNIIVCSATATLEPQEGRYDWVSVPNDVWLATQDATYGTVEAYKSAGLWNFDICPYLLDDTANSVINKIGYTFEAGTFSKGGSSFKVFMTPGGVFVGDNGLSLGGFAGAISPESFNLSDAVNRTYLGMESLYFTGTGTSDGFPVNARKHPTISNALIGNGFIQGQPEKGEDPDYKVKITFEATAQPGIFTAYQTDNSDYTNVYKLIASKVGNEDRYMLFGAGEDEGQPSNIFLIQTN